MDDPYRPPQNGETRVFKTPVFVPQSVVLVILIYVGYAYFYATRDGVAPLANLIDISFELFLLCEIGIASIIFFNKKQVDQFLSQYPSIESLATLEILKPIIRTNMYSALFSFLFLAIGSLTAIMTILNHGLIKALIVGALSWATAWLIKWYTPSEEKLKQIECTSEVANSELNNLLHCWVHKTLPDF